MKSMDPSKNLQQIIASITISHKGAKRAPHKPLLLLYVLASYQHSHNRLFDYGSEIQDNLHIALEAAHIKWNQHGELCEVANSLALCAIHHKAFDKSSLGVDENMRIQMPSAVNENCIVSRLFWDFSGAQIQHPMQKENYPQENFIAWHT
jgi:predicted restriction endonuclease